MVHSQNDTKKKIACIDVRIGTEVYKLASIVMGNDRSIYILQPITSREKSMGSKISPLKYSYHPTGENHLSSTLGEGGATRMLFPDNRVISEIAGLISTDFGMSYFDINTINQSTVILDRSKGKRGYRERVIINAENFKHITLGFHLASKGAKEIDNPRHKYKEIHLIDLGELWLVVTVRDYWPMNSETTNK